jgi:glutamate--cysteine ligase
VTGRTPQFKLPPSVAAADTPITSRAQLLSHFVAGEKPAGPFVLGVELELLPILADGTAAPYSSPGDGPSVTRVLRNLAAAEGLAPVVVNGNLVGLAGPEGPVHLEPGGQVELALPPRATAAEVAADLLRWRRALRAASSEAGVFLVPLGLQPVSRVADITWNPRNRYRIMRDHLGARGMLAHHMMKATAGTQYNLDHASEDDAASMFRASLGASPVVNALFAASPLEEGRPSGWLTIRPHVWANTDPGRTGILEWAHDPGFTYERWLEWACAASLMFVVRDGEWVTIGDRTFDEFMAGGHPVAGAALHEDFALHLTTLFPEVRLKQHVEIRGADSAEPELVAAGAALWRGLIYDACARRETVALTSGWTAEERRRFHEDTARHGLRASIRGRSAQDLAKDLLELAAAGLRRLEGPEGSDAAMLQPLQEIAERGVTRAEDLLRDWSSAGVKALLARA